MASCTAEVAPARHAPCHAPCRSTLHAVAVVVQQRCDSRRRRRRTPAKRGRSLRSFQGPATPDHKRPRASVPKPSGERTAERAERTTSAALELLGWYSSMPGRRLSRSRPEMAERCCWLARASDAQGRAVLRTTSCEWGLLRPQATRGRGKLPSSGTHCASSTSSKDPWRV